MARTPVSHQLRTTPTPYDRTTHKSVMSDLRSACVAGVTDASVRLALVSGMALKARPTWSDMDRARPVPALSPPAGDASPSSPPSLPLPSPPLARLSGPSRGGDGGCELLGDASSVAAAPMGCGDSRTAAGSDSDGVGGGGGVDTDVGSCSWLIRAAASAAAMSSPNGDGVRERASDSALGEAASCCSGCVGAVGTSCEASRPPSDLSLPGRGFRTGEVAPPLP